VYFFSRSKNPGVRLAFEPLTESEVTVIEEYMKEKLAKRFPDGKVSFTGVAIIASGFK
jgi:hypothetical protein